jgi:lysophospholipase L1-like esterase
VTPRWVATWGRAPSTQHLDALLPVVPAPATPVFADQTLREIAHASVGGDAVRVHLSNAFGGEAVHVGAAHVALRASGAATAPGTDRVLTFAGRPSVRILPGAVVVSDPVALDVPALGDLAVSIYLPHATPGTTVHSCGSDTSYVLGGDRSAVQDPVVASTTLALYFLTNVEVRASPDVGLVVCLGDSITDGVRSTPDAHRAWPDVLAARLAEHRHGRPFAVVNQGYAGNRLLRDRCGTSALARFERDVIAQRGVTDVIVFEGINDIGMPTFGLPEEHVTAEEIVAGYRRLVARAHDAGLRIHGATLTPFEGAEAYTPAGEAKRQVVNEFIRGRWELDAVFDFDAAVRDDTNPRSLLWRYDSDDHVHPNDAGHAALADAVDLRAFS